MISSLELEASEPACCRVCRGKGTDDSPLFYPCRCSGSIKYVHQECLVEWLKLSKKTYCELCHHKFSFTPIYRDGTPEKLPWSVVFAAIAHRMLKGFGNICSLTILSALWFVALPLISGYVFDFYFDFCGDFVSAETNSFLSQLPKIIMNFNTGAILQVIMIGTFLSLMLLRDYIVCTACADEDVQQEKKRTLAKRAKAREAANAGIATLDSSGDQPPLDALSNTVNIKPSIQSDGVRPAIISRRRIEVGKEVNAALSIPPDAKTDGRWINQITNREYRSFLKRRELLRQKEKAAQAVQHSAGFTSEWEEHVEDGARPEDNFDDDLESIHSESLFSGGATSRASTKKSGASELRRRNIIKLDFSNSPIRCKICSSNYCVDREHVVQASQLSLKNHNTEALVQAEPPQQQTAVPIPKPKNPIFNFCLNLEQESEEALASLKYALGYSSNLRHGAFNWIMTLSVSLLFFHTFLYGPLLLGKFIFGGLAIDIVKAAFNFLFASAFENTSQLLSQYRFATYIALIAQRFVQGYDIVDRMANINNLTLLFSGHAALYLVASTVIKGKLEKDSEKSLILFYVQQWISFAVTLQKATFIGSIEYFVLPAASFTLLASHSKILFNTSSIEEALKANVHISCLLCIAGGITLRSLTGYVFEQIKSSMRPGFFFFVYGLIPETKVVVRRILEESLGTSIIRLLIKGLVCAVTTESLIAGPLAALRWLLGGATQLKLFNLQRLEENALHFGFSMLLQLLLLVSQTKLLFKIALDLQNRLIKQLRLRSLCYGGRFVPDEVLIKKGAGYWAFFPDQDKVYKWSRVRKMASVEVEPIDIARLPIKENQKTKPDFEDQTAPREGATRFKGYTVVFCPPFSTARLLTTVATFTLSIHAILLLMTWIPLKLGEKLIDMIPSTEINGYVVKLVPVGNYQIGLCALSCLEMLFAKAYGALQNGRTTHFVKKAINFTKKAICVALLFIVAPLLIGTWLHLVASPLSSANDELPLATPFSLFASGFLGLYIILFVRCKLDKQYQEYLSFEYSQESFSTIAFLRQVLLPIIAPLLLATVLPPLAVLIVAPATYMDESTIISSQKKSFALFLILPKIYLILKMALRAHQKMMLKTKDEAYLTGLKLQDYSGVALHN